MTRTIAAGVLTGLLLAGAAQAQQPTVYTWTGYGTNVTGSSKCPTYKMTIDVTVTGNDIKAIFQQQGRPERHFEAVKDATGAFKTKAEVGGGGSMDVTGSLAEANPAILLDGYCKFGGKLTKK